MISKFIEIYCDYCNCADHFFDTIKSANEEWKENGGLIIKRKHYCDIACFNKSQNNEATNE